MKVLHSIAVPERAVAADTVEIDDLAVNPLSVVLIALRPLNDTGTITNFADYLSVCGALNNVRLNHRGTSVINASGRDLAAMNWFRHGILPFDPNNDDVNNDRRCVVLPILTGRFPYDTGSCLPATRRGELTLELDIDIADTGYDGFRFSVETIELLGASPSNFERKTTVSQTFAATGESDVNLPLGHVCRGVLCFGTTGFNGGTPAPSLGRMRVMLDNREEFISGSDFEVAHMLPSLYGRQPPAYDSHTHLVPTNTGANEETTGPREIGSGGWVNYCFLDFDPTRDDKFSIDTKGKSDFLMRVNAETADACRFVTIEKVASTSV